MGFGTSDDEFRSITFEKLYELRDQFTRQDLDIVPFSSTLIIKASSEVVRYATEKSCYNTLRQFLTQIPYEYIRKTDQIIVSSTAYHQLMKDS